MASFESEKSLKFIITLGRGKFNERGDDQVILQGFRALANVDKAAGMMMGQLRARIYGVSESNMHTITTLAMQAAKYSEMNWIPNTVEVFAIENGAETMVFAGNIINAFADYQSMPDVFLNIQAQAGVYNQLKPIAPKSYNGAVDVATIMGQLAKDMGYTLENNGVNITLTDVYLDNTAMVQAQTLARMAGIQMIIDDNVLVILPPNQSRESQSIPVISPLTGLIGYPTLDAAGVVAQSLFNPAVRFMQQFRLESDQVRATGNWIATCVSYLLESEKPNAAWFMATRGNFEGVPYVGKN